LGGQSAVSEERPIRREVRLLYEGRSKRAKRFRYALIVFDVASIIYFVGAVALPVTPVLTVVNLVLGLLILADFSARLWIANDRLRHMTRVYVLTDLVVLLSILAMPFLIEDLAVLRIVRGLRLVHSFHLLRDLRRDSPWFRRHEDVFVAGINLSVFILVMTSLAYVLFFESHSGIASYIDALYFIVATLTTTGFGDITLTTPAGKLFAVVVMVVGVALFVQLARALFQPSKVKYTCPSCGLNRHDPDAVHCKHCGEGLKIPTTGHTP
jgi:voltage-gated potassium channel